MGDAMTISQQLRQARQAAGEDLAALARRTGVRQENLRAIEDGRFADLPRGIYGRAAVKSFAAAFGFDGAAVLADCEPLLTPLDEPIAALARARGVRRPAAEGTSARDTDDHDELTAGSSWPEWRPLAAAAVDAAIIAVMLGGVVVAALTMLIAPVTALRDAGGAFAIMGLLLASGYYFCFGGVRGATIGERTMAIAPRATGSAVTLREAVERALLAATVDARCIARSGERIGRSAAGWMSSAPGEAKG